MYAGVPYPNADDRALSMAASSVTTSGLPNRFRTFWESKASRLVMHFCNRSIRCRFCPAVRIGGLGLGGGTERRAMWFLRTDLKPRPQPNSADSFASEPPPYRHPLLWRLR